MNHLSRRFGRRAAIRGVAAASASGVIFGLPTSPISAQTSAAGGWEFTDFRGRTVSLSEVPTRIVAQTTSAASLLDFGIEVVGFYGPDDSDSGNEFLQVGRLDVSSLTHIGDWGTLDLEKLVGADPDIYVDLHRGGGLLWYMPDPDTEALVEDICPTIGIDANGVPFMDTVRGFEELAVALGADAEGPQITEDKASLTGAEDAIKAAIAGKDGLKIVAISADATGVRLWNSNWLNDMQYLQSLGVATVDVGVGDNEYGADISLEQLGNYPADVYLVDDRQSLDDLTGIAAWDSLPAVQAGQVGTWYSSVLYSYRSLAEALNLYAEVLAKAEPVG